jgi:mono/diheme cytochrome c family protein
MSNLPPNDSRVDQAAITDESLLAAHEKLLAKQPDEHGHYKLQPLLLLFFGSALIMFCGTYIGRHAGHFNASVFNENAKPHAPGEVVAAAPVDPVVLGKKLFNDAACATCHQATGLGMPGAIPPLAGSEWVNGSEERLVRIALYGLMGPITVKGTHYANGVMPPFGKGIPASMKNWRDDQIAAVLTYVRQEWGNKGGPITPEKVTEIHNKDGARGPYAPADLEKLP